MSHPKEDIYCDRCNEIHAPDKMCAYMDGYRAGWNARSKWALVWKRKATQCCKWGGKWVDIAKERFDKIERAKEALDLVDSALGDRLLAEGPLSKPYAHVIMARIRNALKELGE
jgi:hypothetical protein